MFRMNTYQEGSFQELTLLGRQPVAAGQSIELDVSVMFESMPFTRQLLTGGIAALYAFYVPYRLIYPEFIDFVSDADGGTTLPTTNVAAPQFFEPLPAGQVLVPHSRRGYKLIYNQFFGAEQFGRWYSNVADDSVVTLNRVRSSEQMLGKVMPQNEAPDTIMNAPVTAGQAAISLDELRRQLAIARSNKRAQMTGDKYVDAMRRMGVSLDWRVQMAPEFLGSSKTEFWPKRTRNTSSTNTGSAVSFYSETMNLKVKRKFFAEFGSVYILLAVRPHQFVTYDPAVNSGVPPLDATINFRNGFPLGDNQAGVDGFNGVWYGLSDNAYMARMCPWLTGQNLVGLRTGQATTKRPWVPISDPTTVRDAVYTGLSVEQVDGSLSFPYAAAMRYISAGPSPARRNVF